ncbi:putative JmjC domain-containing histone demethylation protein 2C [Anabarilius grahami]|uniref:Putative JmjC domain-containing histone demethylation protein 2C n=1 Tax=Anabarilius grahami TaxID=495550 RepID=A0A3N0Y476_ANAGA|nr:putative JmjC domain-containing histone demethylation protein 2C [Anabarilius grahami]
MVVGKRFLCVSGEEPLEPAHIARWSWRAGVIRAVTHRDHDNPELTQQLAVKSWKWPCDLWLKKTARNMRPVVVHRPPPLQHSIKAAMFSRSPEPELTYREIALCSV